MGGEQACASCSKKRDSSNWTEEGESTWLACENFGLRVPTHHVPAGNPSHASQPSFLSTIHCASVGCAVSCLTRYTQLWTQGRPPFTVGAAAYSESAEARRPQSMEGHRPAKAEATQPPLTWVTLRRNPEPTTTLRNSGIYRVLSPLIWSYGQISKILNSFCTPTHFIACLSAQSLS